VRSDSGRIAYRCPAIRLSSRYMSASVPLLVRARSTTALAEI
jgi:hypothetical protein